MTDMFEVRIDKGRSFSKISDARKYAMRYIPNAPRGNGKVEIYEKGLLAGAVWYDERREQFVWTSVNGRTQVLDRRGIQSRV